MRIVGVRCVANSSNYDVAQEFALRKIGRDDGDE